MKILELYKVCRKSKFTEEESLPNFHSHVPPLSSGNSLKPNLAPSQSLLSRLSKGIR